MIKPMCVHIVMYTLHMKVFVKDFSDLLKADFFNMFNKIAKVFFKILLRLSVPLKMFFW